MSIEKYWQDFVSENPEYKEQSYTAWQFGVDPDELAELVTEGKKTLTCSGFKEYEVENETLPAAGDVGIVLGEGDVPKCIIENTKVYTLSFKDAGDEIAYKEGEGDRTLSYWRTAHLDFFEPLYKSIGLEFNESEKIVVEEFKMIYE